MIDREADNRHLVDLQKIILEQKLNDSNPSARGGSEDLNAPGESYPNREEHFDDDDDPVHFYLSQMNENQMEQANARGNAIADDDSSGSLSLEEITAIVDSNKLSGQSGIDHRVAACICFSVVIFPILVLVIFGLSLLGSSCRPMKFPEPHEQFHILTSIPESRVHDTFGIMRSRIDKFCRESIKTKTINDSPPKANEKDAFSDPTLSSNERECMYSLRMFSIFGQIQPCYKVKDWPLIESFSRKEGEYLYFRSGRRFAEAFENSSNLNRSIFCKRQCLAAIKIYKELIIQNGEPAPDTICDGLPNECSVPKVVRMYSPPNK